MPNEVEPIAPNQLTRNLEFLESTLPTKNTDEKSGQMRTAVYVRILGGYTKAAISYMVERACKEHDWFPTPKQCLDILAGYSPPVTVKQKALYRCEQHTQAHFDQFVAELRAGAIPQSQIDTAPERWRRICVETGLLMRRGENYAQRIKIPAD